MIKRRTVAVYLTSAFVVFIILLSVYFFAKKPERVTSNRPEQAQRVMVFRDVKYSGEKRGTVDWEVRAKLVKQYVDRSMVEMEGIQGEYRPRPDTIVSFKGLKGEMDTAKEVGVVQDVEVSYKGEYALKSSSMNFDFKKSTAFTSAPVDLRGKQMMMAGSGLNLDAKEQVITIEKDVNGTIQTEKEKFRFTADTFAYFLKDGTYLLQGKVVVKGDQMSLTCDKVNVYSKQGNFERIDAEGRVRILAKGTIAKSGRAVYYLRQDRVVLKEEPSIVRDSGEMLGGMIVYNLKTEELSVEKPKVRIERRP